MTKVINLIGAPSCGKSILASLIFAELKKRNKHVEIVQEWIKHLIWQKDFDIIKNQYYITQQQYLLISNLNNIIYFII